MMQYINSLLGNQKAPKIAVNVAVRPATEDILYFKNINSQMIISNKDNGQ